MDVDEISLYLSGQNLSSLLDCYPFILVRSKTRTPTIWGDLAKRWSAVQTAVYRCTPTSYEIKANPSYIWYQRQSKLWLLYLKKMLCKPHGRELGVESSNTPKHTHGFPINSHTKFNQWIYNARVVEIESEAGAQILLYLPSFSWKYTGNKQRPPYLRPIFTVRGSATTRKWPQSKYRPPIPIWHGTYCAVFCAVHFCSNRRTAFS